MTVTGNASFLNVPIIIVVYDTELTVLLRTVIELPAVIELEGGGGGRAKYVGYTLCCAVRPI